MKKLLQFNLKYFWAAPLVLLCLAVVGFNYASHLKINLDLAGLLPEDSESIREMNNVVAKVGGGGYVIVLVGPMTSPEKTLVPMSEKLHDLKDIKYTYFEREEFALKDKALFILPKKDFKQLTEHAQVLFSNEVVDTTGLGLVDESDHAEQVQEAKDFFNKLKKRTSTDQYFLSQDKKYAMLLIRPEFDSTDLKRSRELIKSVRETIDQSFKFPYSLSGRYVEKAEEEVQFEKDISKTGIISNVTIVLLLLWGLGTIAGAVSTAVFVIISMCLTAGLAAVVIGQINILTGFLLAILSGLGAEFGIHFIRRYHQERTKGAVKDVAIRNTYFHLSRKALFSSALTTSCSFFILAYSDFRGFSELGIIAGIGILVIYLVFVLAFPLMAKILPENFSKIQSSFVLGKYPVKYGWRKGLFILIPVILFGLYHSRFEYDFEKLHNFPPELQKINAMTDQIFGRAITPSAIAARDKEQVEELSEWLRSEENDHTVDMVVSLYDLVPDDMAKRQSRMQKLRTYVLKADEKELEEKSGLKKEKILTWLETAPYDRSFIPKPINDNFGEDGNILLVFPKERQGTYDNIRRYAQTLQNAKKEFPGMEVGSDTLVFAEILHHIIEDGQFVLFLFLAGTLFIFWLDFRRIKDALYLEFQLVCCIVLLVALMGLVGVPFTILNVAMIPQVLAAGIDMGVHVHHREREGHPPLLSAALDSHAIQLGAIISILGFGSLLFASSKMLKGVAWISILGQVSSYIICMIVFPLVKEFFKRNKK